MRYIEKFELVKAARVLDPTAESVTIVYGDGTTEEVLASWGPQAKAGAFSCEM